MTITSHPKEAELITAATAAYCYLCLAAGDVASNPLPDNSEAMVWPDGVTVVGLGNETGTLAYYELIGNQLRWLQWSEVAFK